MKGNAQTAALNFHLYKDICFLVIHLSLKSDGCVLHFKGYIPVYTGQTEQLLMLRSLPFFSGISAGHYLYVRIMSQLSIRAPLL